MHLRSTFRVPFVLASQLILLASPITASAQPKIHLLDQPNLDKDGAGLKPLSLLPPEPAKLTRREQIAADKAARVAAKAAKQAGRTQPEVEDVSSASAVDQKPSQVASIDPAEAATETARIEMPKTSTEAQGSASSEPKSGVRALIAQHAAAYGVPFHLADAMVKIESRYNPKARNGVNLGLGQINLRTAQGLGYKGGAAGLFDANTNLTYSIKYLAQAYRLARGEVCGAITRYQNGFGATRMNGANRAYCSKVKAHIG